MVPFFKLLYQQVTGWIYSGIMFSLLTIFLVGSLGLASRYASPTIVKWWGRGMLFWCGVRLNAVGTEHLKGAKARVVTYNHASNLDIFVICALLPTAGVHVMKRELLFVPFVGWGPWLMRYIFVDRRNRDRAIASMKKASKRVKEEELTVFIAPEGTRSKTSELLPFKMGAFHLAHESGAPIYPLIIKNARDLWPHPKRYSVQGTLNVEILPPIDSSGFTAETLQERVEQLRQLYVKEIQSPTPDETSPLRSWAS